MSPLIVGPTRTILIIHREEHHKRVKKSNLSCPFFPEAPGPKSRSRTTSLRSAARPKSRAGSRQPQPAASETSASDDDSQPAPPRPSQRSRMTATVSASKERDASDVLRRSTRSSRAKPPPEVEEDASGTELSRSNLGRSRNKSSGKGKGKGHIEVIEEADEDDIARPVPPTKLPVKGKENVSRDAKVPKTTRHTKTFRANDAEEEAHQPKRRPAKKGRAALDEREESSVGSESDVRPVGKRRTRGVERVSSRETSPEEIKPKKVQAPMKKVKERTRINVLESEDDRIDETEGLPRPVKKTLPKAPAQRRAKPRAIEDSNEGSDDDLEEVEQTEKPLPSLDRGKDEAQSRSVAILESTETAASWSSDEAVIPVPAPVKNSDKVVKGKGSKTTGVTASQRERYRSRTTSDSSSSPEPIVSEGEASTTSSAPHDVQTDMVEIDLDAASAPATPAREKGEMTIHPGSELVRGMDDRALAPPALSSPECPELRTLQREEEPVTPPPPSSSLLSVSSTTSTTKVEGHTDTETLVEPLPVQANSVQLTEEERMMTVEQWVRHGIEVEYERLRLDGETKIRLFKKRAEEVRRQVEAL